MLAALLITSLLGIVLLAVGLRGRRVNDDPYCSKCRFDLRGLAPPDSTPTQPCPECGADLSAAHAIRIGRRRRRRAALALGILLLLAAAGIGGAMAWGWATAFNWNTIKPAWMLSREAESRDPTAAGAALAELAARLQNDRLARATADDLVARGLERQGDPEQTWHVGWGRLIEAAWTKGALSPDQKATYARQGAAGALRLVCRPTALQNGQWMVNIANAPARVGSVGGGVLALRFRMVELRVGDAPVGDTAPALHGRMDLDPRGGSSTGRAYTMTAAPGEHEVTCRLEVDVVETADPQGRSVAEHTLTLTAPVTVFPPDAELVKLIPDASLREQMLSKITVSRCALSRRQDPPWAQGDIRIDDPPMGVAFDVIWRVGEREWQVGHVATRPGTTHSFGYGENIEGFDADTVTLILRPSVDAALRSLDLTEIWDGELVFPDLPVAGGRAETDSPDAPDPK